MWTNYPFLLVCSFFRPAALGNPPRGGCSVDATPAEIRSSPGPSRCAMPWVWGIKKKCHHDMWNIVKPWNHHDISWYIYPIIIHYQQICLFLGMKPMKHSMSILSFACHRSPWTSRWDSSPATSPGLGWGEARPTEAESSPWLVWKCWFQDVSSFAPWHIWHCSPIFPSEPGVW